MPGRMFSLLAMTLVVTSVVWSQETRGTIVGRVTDPTGAAIPNADVQVVNQAMGTTVTLKSNESGIYTAPLLLPGLYKITVSGAGFKTFVRENVQLQVEDRLEVNAT